LDANSGGRFYIHAVNVHHGGGATLLRALLGVRLPYLSVAQLDMRMAVPEEAVESAVIRWIRPSLSQRLRAEWWLAKTASSKDTILCFGNLPPLFKTAGQIIVFVQNRYLIDEVSLKGFPLKTRLRLQIERWWLSSRATNVHAFAVQSPSMQAILQSSGITNKKPVYVLPFVSAIDCYKRSFDLHDSGAVAENTFLYVGSGEPHKNHRKLIEAWCILSKEGHYPTLLLTLDEKVHADLCFWIDKKKQDFRLNLQNLGWQSHAQIKHLYVRVQALIYPSTLESFGLPLIEARQAGLPVLASELDYVRDVLDPEQSFNPESATSIARAIKRFIGIDEPPLPLLDARGFLDQIFNKVN
jgi:glycosyltransferase involved in cell wall biosynthesis